MAGSKRRRKSSEKSPSRSPGTKRSAKAAADVEVPKVTYLVNLIHRLKSIKAQKADLEASTKLIVDGKALVLKGSSATTESTTTTTSSPSAPTQASNAAPLPPIERIAYEIFLATHTLEKIQTALDLTKDANVRLVLSVLSLAVGEILLGAIRLEGAVPAARPLLGRTCLSASVAALQLAGGELEDNDDAPRLVIPSILTLDCVISQMAETPSTDDEKAADQIWKKLRSGLLARNETNIQQDAWEQACHEVDEMLDWSTEVAFLQALENTSAPQPSSLSDLMEAMDLPTTKSDRRLAFRQTFRRWTPVTLLHTCQAQEHILRLASNFLDNSSYWEGALEMNLDSEEISKTDEHMKSEQDKTFNLHGNAANIALVCRLVRLVWEMEKQAGVCSFPNSLDAYCRILLQDNSKRGKTKPARPDIRDGAAVIMYKLVQGHHACLEANLRGIEGLRVVNDLNWTNTVSSAMYYPFVNLALAEISNAASTSVQSDIYWEQVKASQRLTYLAAAHAAQLQVCNPEVPIDARVTKTIMGCLTEALSKPESATEELHPDKPLPVPSQKSKSSPKISRSRKTTASPKICSTFGGAYPHLAKTTQSGERSTFTASEKLALFARAMVGVAPKGKAASAFVSYLLSIIEKCYDTTICDGDLAVHTFAAEVTGRLQTRKRAAELNPTRKKKKRKASSKVDEISGGHESEPENRAISLIRASVASESLQALKDSLGASSSGGFLADFSILMHSQLEEGHLRRLVDAGNKLTDLLFKGRIFVPTLEWSSPDTVPDTLFSTHERELWAKHSQLCASVGRGDGDLDPACVLVLGERRWEIFNYIAESTGVDGKYRWPLRLFPPNRNLILSNLICNRVRRVEDENRAELCVLKGMVLSIEKALTEIYEISNSRVHQNEIECDPCLSLFSLRMFLIALTKVTPVQAMEVLRTLIQVVRNSISTIAEDQRLSTLVKGDDEVSGFLARVLTLCVSATVIHSCPSMRECIESDIKRIESHEFPVIYLGSSKSNPSKVFDSFLGDSMSAALPNIPSSVDRIDDSLGEILDETLDIALRLGFAAYPVDNGHLLFSAWNSMAKREVWSRTVSSIELCDIDSLGPLDLIPKLRDDMFYIHRLKRSARQLSSDSFMMRVSDDESSPDRTTGNARTELIKSLQKMIDKADGLVDAILRDSENKGEDVKPQLFALLEAIVIYVTYAVSSFTRSDHDQPSSMLQCLKLECRVRSRARAYSSESEGAHSEEISVDSNCTNFETFDRLKECCSFFGAVPAHPDWLDSDCSLWTGISYDQALDSSTKAMQCLLKIARTAATEIEALQARALLGPEENRRCSIDDVDCVVRFMKLQAFAPIPSGPLAESVESLTEDLSKAFKVHPLTVKILLGEAVLPERSKFMSPRCLKSAQKIIGEFHLIFQEGVYNCDRTVLRAGGEWEILLADAVSSSAQGAFPMMSSSLDQTSNSRCEIVRRWTLLSSSVLQYLVPAAALLRRSVVQKPRNTHPLKVNPGSAQELASFDVYDFESVIPNTSVTDSVIATVHDAMSLVLQTPHVSSSSVVAAHLLVEPTFFDTMKIVAINKKALDVMSNLWTTAFRDKMAHSTEAFSGILRYIIGMLSPLASHDRENAGASDELIKHIYASLGAPGFSHVDTIVSSDVEINVFFSDWMPCNSACIADLSHMIIAIVMDESVNSTLAERRLFTDILVALIAFEQRTTLPGVKLSENIISAFQMLPAESLVRLMTEVADAVAMSDAHFVDSICMLLSLLLLENRNVDLSRLINVVHSTLHSTLRDWNTVEHKGWNSLLLLYLLFSIHEEKVVDSVNTLFELLEGEWNSDKKLSVGSFATSAEFLKRCVMGKSEKNESQVPVVSFKLLDTCSYNARRGFHDQHWYHCYTCGLTWDKGCCTLCALTCHKDHDVAYARFSSFFCDCGAGDGSKGNGGKSGCKCISRLCADELSKVRQFALSRDTESSREGSVVMIPNESGCLMSVEAVAWIADKAFERKCNQALEGLDDLTAQKWLILLFNFVRNSFFHAKNNTVNLSSGPPQFSTSFYWFLANTLADKAPNARRTIETIPSWTMSLFLRSKPGSFISSSVKRIPSSRDSGVVCVQPCCLLTDSRSRMIIAENNSIIFSCGAQVMQRCSTSTGKHTVPIWAFPVLGTVSFEKAVNGIALAADNELNVGVWGSNHASILMMESSFERPSMLAPLDFRDDFGEVTKGIWLTGSCGCFILGLEHALLFFDVSNAGETPLQPFATIHSSHRSRISDFVVVPSETPSSPYRSWKIYAVLNDKIQQLSMSSPDGVAVVVDKCFREDKLLALHLRGECIPKNISFANAGVSFLSQSRMLIVQSRDIGAIAFHVDAEGCIAKSSELIPAILKRSEQPQREILGPFGKWTELGVVCDDGDYFFRVACIGNDAITSNPILLFLDFNGSRLRLQAHDVAEVSCNSIDQLAVEGLAAFTIPIIHREHRKGASAEGDFTFLTAERLVVSVMLSDGTFLMFEEGLMAPAGCLSPRPIACAGPVVSDSLYSRTISDSTRFPLVSFEILDNLTEKGVVRYQGLGLGSPEDLERKLLRDNDDFLTRTDRSGFSFTASVDQFASECYKTRPNSTSQNLDGWAIVAIRFLVGSTVIESIPSTVTVCGRQQKIRRGARKWYQIVLTAEEIALVMRNGFISISVNETFDRTKNPIVDAFEVYGVKRRFVESWCPAMTRSVVASIPIARNSMFGSSNLIPQREPTMESFVRNVTALTAFQFLFKCSEIDTRDRQLVKEIVQESALSDDDEVKKCGRDLLRAFELDADDFQLSYDKAVVNGCLVALQKLLEMKVSEMSLNIDLAQASVRQCLSVAITIVKTRPINYLQAVSKKSTLKDSISSLSAKILSAFLSESICDLGLVSQFVQLCLFEMAVASGCGAEFCPMGGFGSFDVLEAVLLTEDQRVVEQACSTIAEFCTLYGSYDNSKSGMVDLFVTQQMVAYYKCDSCELFPITDIRYTLLDDDHPFDLCKDCYKAANDFASNVDLHPTSQITIHGKPVGEDTYLTHAELQKMQPVAIQKPVASGREEVRVDQELGGSAVHVDDCSHECTENFQRQRLFDEFVEKVLSGLEKVYIPESDDPAQKFPFVSLAIDLVWGTHSNKLKGDRLKRLAEILSSKLNSALYKAKDSSQRHDPNGVSLCLSALVCLMSPDSGVRDYFIGLKHVADSVPTGVELVSCLHGCPASRRKFASGLHVGRSFYVCGVERKTRCNFFKWADDEASTRDASPLYDDSTAKAIWNFLRTIPPTGGDPPYIVLCSYLESLKAQQSSTTQRPQCSDYDATLVSNGFLCNLNRLQRGCIFHGSACICWRSTNHRKINAIGDKCGDLVNNALELMSLSAQLDMEQASSWHSYLCKVLLHRGVEPLVLNRTEELAKCALLQLCGRQQQRYLAVRDRFAFEFQYQSLCDEIEPMLRHCVKLNEKAHFCSQFWRTSFEPSIDRISMRCLVGTHHLIEENLVSTDSIVALSSILDNILAYAQKRACNWRRFCTRILKETVSTSSPKAPTILPHVALMVAAFSCYPIHVQTKATKLLGLGLKSPEQKQAKARAGLASGKENIEDSTSKLLTERMLCPSVDDVLALVIVYVCHDNSHDARVAAYSAAKGLIECLDTASQHVVLEKSCHLARTLIGRRGVQTIELLNLLLFTSESAFSSYPNPTELSTLAFRLWREQVLATRHDRLNRSFMHFEARAGSSIQRKRFDLSVCLPCHETVQTKVLEKGARIPTTSKAEERNTASTSDSPSLNTFEWVPNQVSPHERVRLDGRGDSCTSNAFNTFFALDYRAAIYEISVDVSDPRGRFVKRINIYYTPRPIKDVKDLKSEQYVSWELCGTIELPRSATHEICSFPRPVVGSNLRIEYADFHDKPGNSNADEGLVIHCPRCTRIVTNAHGVCGNCGEVAFQCRKCRHINYDRLDAFLCVECGYCPSGTFSYAMQAGVVSNAVVITNEEEFGRAVAMNNISLRVRELLLRSLQKKLKSLTSSKHKHLECSSSLSSSIERAFFGNLPLDPENNDDDGDTRLVLSQLRRPGAVVKLVASNNFNRASGDNLISLLRLSRDRRSGSTMIRSRRAETIVIRQLRRGDGDDDDYASEFINGLLESGGGSLARATLGLDPSDSLGRLLATVQSRREQRAAAEEKDGQGDSDQSGGANPRSHGRKAKETFSECDKLYRLMCEAECEAFRLQQRIEAWKRLDEGNLGNFVIETDDNLPFEPSHCPSCAIPISVHLLELWRSFLRARPFDVVVTKEMISLLLADDTSYHSRSLQDKKREVVADIALYSPSGSHLVLEALHARLNASQDGNSAEILGRIMKSTNMNDELGRPFIELGMQVLESGPSF